MDRLLRIYTVIVHEAQADEAGFWAEVEELPGCFASGDTLDDLETDIRDAIEAYILSLSANGDPIPEGRGSVHQEGTRRWEIAVQVA